MHASLVLPQLEKKQTRCMFMLHDVFKGEFEDARDRPPISLGGCSVTIHLTFDGWEALDGFFDKAVANGAKVPFFRPQYPAAALAPSPHRPTAPSFLPLPTLRADQPRSRRESDGAPTLIARPHPLLGMPQATMAVKDQFWGDRYGEFQDPFGYRWSVSSAHKDPVASKGEPDAKKAKAGE